MGTGGSGGVGGKYQRGPGCRGELPRDGRQGRTRGAARSCCRAVVPFPGCHRDLRGGSSEPRVRGERRGLRGGPRQASGVSAWTSVRAHCRLRAPSSEADPGPGGWTPARPSQQQSLTPQAPASPPGHRHPHNPRSQRLTREERGSGLQGCPRRTPGPPASHLTAPSPALPVPAAQCREHVLEGWRGEPGGQARQTSLKRGLGAGRAAQADGSRPGPAGCLTSPTQFFTPYFSNKTTVRHQPQPSGRPAPEPPGSSGRLPRQH